MNKNRRILSTHASSWKRSGHQHAAFVFVTALSAMAGLSAAAPGPFGTYQGQLKLDGAPVTEQVDLIIGVWDTISHGNLLFEAEFPAVKVQNGLFSIDLLGDPSVFDGSDRFLEIEVRSPHDPTDSERYTLLTPRQAVRPVPYALHVMNPVPGHALNASDGSPTNSVFVNADGEVGIGTTAPAADLHVRGKNPLGKVIITPSVADSSAELLITENQSATLGAMMRYDGVTNQWQVLGLSRDAANVPVIFGPHMAIGRDNGLVGIGTTTPEDRLHVFKADAGAVASNSNASVIIEDDSATYLNFMTPSTAENGLLFGLGDVSNASGGIIYNSSNNPLGMQFRTGGNATRMVIDSIGQVGMGTTTPERRLEIEAAQASMRLDTSNSTFGSALELRNTTPGGLGLGFIRFMNATDTTTARGEILYRGDNSMSFNTNAAERMRIISSGNVGIGTTSPQSRLHVAGEIRSSSGGIRYPDNTVQTTATLQGPAGPPGPAGQRGQACWDLNNNGVGNVATEDRNGDGVVNVDDCRGDPGPTGVPATSFAVCGTSLSCNSACGGSENVLGEAHESGSGTPNAGCSVTSDTGSCESISDLSDDCCVCKQP